MRGRPGLTETGRTARRIAARTVGLTKGRIPFHDKILPFEIAEPVQLAEICPERPATVDGLSLGGLGRMNNGNAFDAGQSGVGLSVDRMSKAHRRRRRSPRDELPPSHASPLRTTPVSGD